MPKRIKNYGNDLNNAMLNPLVQTDNLTTNVKLA